MCFVPVWPSSADQISSLASGMSSTPPRVDTARVPVVTQLVTYPGGRSASRSKWKATSYLDNLCPGWLELNRRPLRPEAKYRRGLPAPQNPWPATDRPWMSAEVRRWPWRLSLTSSFSRRACADGCWPDCGAVGDVSLCCSRTPVTKGRPSSSPRARARARPTSASTRTQGARTGDSHGHIRHPRGRPVHGGRCSHRAVS